jgi:hypothetical protein
VLFANGEAFATGRSKFQDYPTGDVNRDAKICVRFKPVALDHTF